MMSVKRNRSARAVAPADVIVSMSLVSLVLLILMPAVRETRQQAEIDTCLTNLSRVMRATTMYLVDYQDRFPYQSRPDAIARFSALGKTNADYWRTSSGGNLSYPGHERPLNPYITGYPLQPDAMDGDDVVARTPMPEVRCPADNISHQRRLSFANGTTLYGTSTYDDVGTSYLVNIHALHDVSWNGNSNPWQAPGTWNSAGRALLRDVLAHDADRYTMFYGDPMAWGLHRSELTIGNHGELGMHSAGYMDGHADYRYRDTRAHCGPGWLTINPRWIRVIGEFPPHPWRYDDVSINCYPSRH
jgi:hypothetical protein